MGAGLCVLGVWPILAWPARRMGQFRRAGNPSPPVADTAGKARPPAQPFPFPAATPTHAGCLLTCKVGSLSLWHVVWCGDRRGAGEVQVAGPLAAKVRDVAQSCGTAGGPTERGCRDVSTHPAGNPGRKNGFSWPLHKQLLPNGPAAYIVNATMNSPKRQALATWSVLAAYLFAAVAAPIGFVHCTSVGGHSAIEIPHFVCAEQAAAASQAPPHTTSLNDSSCTDIPYVLSSTVQHRSFSAPIIELLNSLATVTIPGLCSPKNDSLTLRLGSTAPPAATSPIELLRTVVLLI